jgi:HipA-like protein
VICKERMTLPRFEAQQSSRGAKASLGRDQAVDFSPVGSRALRISTPCHTGHGGIASVANSTSLMLRPSASPGDSRRRNGTIAPSIAARGARHSAPIHLSLYDETGKLNISPMVKTTRVAPFFSNLLPEGRLREFVAQQAGMKSGLEQPLLRVVGAICPGRSSGPGGG